MKSRVEFYKGFKNFILKLVNILYCKQFKRFKFSVN